MVTYIVTIITYTVAMVTYIVAIVTYTVTMVTYTVATVTYTKLTITLHNIKPTRLVSLPTGSSKCTQWVMRTKRGHGGWRRCFGSA